jgi:hypothetical protein
VNTLMTRSRFRRRSCLLWRDTGVHVLVLPPRCRGQVVVLGGGSAAVWRLLDNPHDVAELSTMLAGSSEEALERAALEDCIAELLGQSILRRVPEVTP